MLIVRQFHDFAEMTAETAESGESSEEENISAQEEMSTQPVEETSTPPEGPAEGSPAPPQAGGRRTQLKVVRESVESLSREVGHLRKSSEANTKKLEAHMKSLRKELGAHARSKDLGKHAKSHRADTARLEKQMASLRKDMASLKSEMAKEAARSRAHSEAAFAKFAAKVKAAKQQKPKIRFRKRKG
jgi:predicted RNase H-like nuclease (RuvC/YqgF family)